MKLYENQKSSFLSFPSMRKSNFFREFFPDSCPFKPGFKNFRRNDNQKVINQDLRDCVKIDFQAIKNHKNLPKRELGKEYFR